jgi:hypothetical protein
MLLVGSGLLFAIGSTIERHQTHAEHPPTAAHSSGERGSSGESEGERHSGEADGETSRVERGVKILGVNTESLTLTILAVAASLLLAAAVWLGRWPRLVLMLVAGFGLVFAVGDAREVVNQLDESNTGLASIAAILIGIHLAVTALAAALFPRSDSAAGAALSEPRV